MKQDINKAKEIDCARFEEEAILYIPLLLFCVFLSGLFAGIILTIVVQGVFF